MRHSIAGRACATAFVLSVAALSSLHAHAATNAPTLEASIVHASATAGSSVVRIETPKGLGSGVIVSNDGFVVTNYHVIAPAISSASGDISITLANGSSYAAQIRGTDAPDDLALLKIDAPNVRPIAFADSNALRVGQFVLAVGNPLGYSQTVTLGIVSTLRRTIPEKGPASFIPDMIQTSAPINPGNSGGALTDLSGRLVGIPTIVAVDPRLGAVAQGIGFAIPSQRVKFVVQQLIAHGRIIHSGRPFLGIGRLVEVNPYVGRQLRLPVSKGILVGSVVQGGPADRAGLRSGDVIVAINSRPTLSEEAFGDALGRLRPGHSAQLSLVRLSGGQETIRVTLGELPVP